MKIRNNASPLTLTEKQFEGQVKHLARLFGWKYYHTWRSIHSPAGFPDVVMVRPPRLIFAELKSEKGELTNEQEEWATELQAIADHSLGVMYFIWKPTDWERILEILK